MNNLLKGVVLMFLISFSSHKAEAQAYKPLLAQFNEWHVTSCFFGCLTDVYFTDTDTVVNGYNYSILDGFHYITRNLLLREDTSERQVFMLVTGIGKEDNEYLLYDFSLQPGDSMPIYNPISPFPDSAGYFILDSIVPEVLIDGDTYRHFYLSALDSAKSVTGRAEWIEGIGSLSLINTPGAYGDFSTAGSLSCFFNNQTLHYSNLDSITGCVQVYPNLSFESEVADSKIVSIFPNPASTVLYINTSDLSIREIVIFDMMGREVQRYATGLSMVDKIDISRLTKGAFIVRVKTEKGDTHVQKLIIE